MIYVIFPVFITIFIFSFKECLINYMSNMKIDGVIFVNSASARNKIFTPYLSSILLVVSLLFTILFAYLCDKFLNKENKKFNLYYAKNILFYLGIVSITIATVVFMYAKSYTFEHWKYGYSEETIIKVIEGKNETLYIPLEEIPSIESAGITSSNASVIYNINVKLSQIVSGIISNLEFMIAILGTILIPLKNKIHLVENTM